jgi:hypothetical protein
MSAPLTYRQSVVVKPTTDSIKNSPLSNIEIDGNMHSMQDAITAIESPSWVTTTRVGDNQVTPNKLSADTNGFKNKIGIQTSDTGSTVIAKGTSVQRDVPAVEGYLRYNTTIGAVEWRNATDWVAAAKTSDIVYIGTTPIALNRANASVNLTGVSIDGNSGTVTNGVYTTGDQTISGNKTFSSNIIGNVIGNAGSVTNGVYTTGDQTIGGNKTFSSDVYAPTFRGSHIGIGAEQPGMVAYFAMSNAPQGWLKANGATVSRTTYSALFAAIGTLYGAGDGSTTFKLPDLRGEFVRGWADGGSADFGRILGSWQADELKTHAHEIYSSNWETGGGSGGIGNLTPDKLSGTTRNTGGSETRPRNVALLVCIKY